MTDGPHENKEQELRDTMQGFENTIINLSNAYHTGDEYQKAFIFGTLVGALFHAVDCIRHRNDTRGILDIQTATRIISRGCVDYSKRVRGDV